MDVRAALKSQYHAALDMLQQAIERCPDELWAGGDHPLPFWQVAYHTEFFTHFYLSADVASFERWPQHRGGLETLGSLPQGTEPATRAVVLEYHRFCVDLVDGAVDALDLDAPECGFPWYRLPKLDHQLNNIRHIQHHAAQLSERVKAAGAPGVDWIGPF